PPSRTSSVGRSISLTPRIPSGSHTVSPVPVRASWPRTRGMSGCLAQMAVWRGCRTAFGGGQCPEGPTVRYAPVFRRDTSALPTNTVPAFVAEADGTLWFGTAVGLTRLQQGHFTPVPFARPLTVPGDVATLEAFFQAVAQALFAAQPLTTVALGGVSFVEQ